MEGLVRLEKLWVRLVELPIHLSTNIILGEAVNGFISADEVTRTRTERQCTQILVIEKTSVLPSNLGVC